MRTLLEVPAPGDVARQRLEGRRPLFRAGWDDVLMIHYAVDPKALQPLVPVEIDLFEGRAYVSLVVFTLARLRFFAGGPAFPAHRFLNVRAYVRDNGIVFLAEWLTNALCVLLGPRLYGLPYRWGRIDYAAGHVRGRVAARDGVLAYQSRATGPLETCVPGSLDHFLMERYTAFTDRRLFHVWHEPWRRRTADVEILDDRLLASTGPWFAQAERVGAHHSPGLPNVWMGRPEESHP
jgi:uncharacterized protein